LILFLYDFLRLPVYYGGGGLPAFTLYVAVALLSTTLLMRYVRSGEFCSFEVLFGR
jgi:hypothetical protein